MCTSCARLGYPAKLEFKRLSQGYNSAIRFGEANRGIAIFLIINLIADALPTDYAVIYVTHGTLNHMTSLFHTRNSMRQFPFKQSGKASQNL